jgi:C4-dicarboxylate-specific signal transduction histidine kinase
MEKTADEVKRLQSCINDLISVLALAAIWSGSESRETLGTLLDSLLAILRLDFACARVNHSIDGSPIEVMRLAQRQHSVAHQQEIGRTLAPWLGSDQALSRFLIPNPTGEGEVAIASFALGLQDQFGVLMAGSRRPDFPTDMERLLLRVAANQAVIGLQEARRSGEQKRLAEALERSVAERTSQLTAVNEELRRSQAYLAEAQRLSHTGSLGWRPATGQILWSQETFRIFQYDQSTIPTLELLLQRVHPEDVILVKRTMERASQDGMDFDHEYRLLMSDNSVRHVHVVAHGFPGGSGGIEFVGAVTDTTASKRAEQALADLAHVSRVITMGELTASIAHEVKQPIAATATNASACLRWLARDTPDIEEARAAAMRIVKDAKRAGEIINEVRLLFEKGTPQRQSIDLNQVIREMIVLLHDETTRHSITVRADLAAALSPVTGDTVQLQQVLMNLIMNSIDSMKRVDDKRELSIESRRAENDQILVSVSDTGAGLPPQVDQIFNAFFTTKRHGTGMGLRISRSIIESHGGRLWAVDNSPRGASFCFTLPSNPP